MFEDSFYLARRELFEIRLGEIREGKGEEYLKRHDDRYRPKQTWCIGLRWDVCEQGQLLEIIKVGVPCIEDHLSPCSIDPIVVPRSLDPSHDLSTIL